MPVTKSAKRALRGSKRKESVNKLIIGKLEVAVRQAQKSGLKEKILSAMSFADVAAKKKTIHKNKAARIKSQMSKLLEKKSESQKTPKTQKVRKSVKSGK